MESDGWWRRVTTVCKGQQGCLLKVLLLPLFPSSLSFFAPFPSFIVINSTLFLFFFLNFLPSVLCCVLCAACYSTDSVSLSCVVCEREKKQLVRRRATLGPVCCVVCCVALSLSLSLCLGCE